MNSIKNAIFGSDNSKPTVETKFSQDNERVVNLLNETITNISMDMETNVEVGNKIGKRKIVVKDGGTYNSDITQTATSQLASTYKEIIEQVMDSDADTNVKLDALAAVTQAVKNDGTFLQGNDSSATNIQLKNSDQTNLTNIQQLNQNLKLAMSMCVVNEIDDSDITVGKNGTFNEKINQTASSISENLIDMIIDDDSTLSDKEKNEYKSQIESNNKAEGTGLIAGGIDEVGKTTRHISDDLNNLFSKFANMGTGVMIAMIAIPIVIIIGIFVMIFMLLRKKNSNNYEDYEDYDDEKVTGGWYDDYYY